MWAARLYGPGDLRVAEEGDPAGPVPGDGRCRVRVRSVGLCGSDLHWFSEGAIGDAVLDRPLVPGHEVSGVALDGPLRGCEVAVDPAVPCRDCPVCRRGDGHLCPTVVFAGHGHVDGGLQEVLVWPVSSLHRLPDDHDPAIGALLEPLGVAVHALDLSHLRAGVEVGVVGCGPIGLMIVQLAAAQGARVVAVEPLAHRREAALRAGATLAVDAVPGGSEHADRCAVVFEASGADEAVAAAARLVAAGGRIVLVGIPDGDVTTLRVSILRRKGVTLAFVRRMTESAYLRGMRLAATGVVDLSWLTTLRFPLPDAAQAFRTAVARDGLKVVVDVG